VLMGHKVGATQPPLALPIVARCGLSTVSETGGQGGPAGVLRIAFTSRRLKQM